jgi:hypothetical protein
VRTEAQIYAPLAFRRVDLSSWRLQRGWSANLVAESAPLVKTLFLRLDTSFELLQQPVMLGFELSKPSLLYTSPHLVERRGQEGVLAGVHVSVKESFHPPLAARPIVSHRPPDVTLDMLVDIVESPSLPRATHEVL